LFDGLVLLDKHLILSGSAAGKIHVDVWRDFLSDIGAVSEKQAAGTGFNPVNTGAVLPYHMVSVVSATSFAQSSHVKPLSAKVWSLMENKLGCSFA
jgi:hypothetical protein